MPYTITYPRTYDSLLGWLSEITLTAPEGCGAGRLPRHHVRAVRGGHRTVQRV